MTADFATDPPSQTRLFDSAIEKSFGAPSTDVSIMLDNMKAMQSLDRGEVHPALSKCLFVQARGHRGTQA